MREVIIISKTPFSYERILVTELAAVELNAVMRAYNCSAVFVTIEDFPIRYRIDGVAPTAVNGHVVVNGANLWLDNKTAIQQLSMIGIGGDAIAIVTYYHE